MAKLTTYPVIFLAFVILLISFPNINAFVHKSSLHLEKLQQAETFVMNQLDKYIEQQESHLQKLNEIKDIYDKSQKQMKQDAVDDSQTQAAPRNPIEIYRTVRRFHKAWTDSVKILNGNSASKRLDQIKMYTEMNHVLFPQEVDIQSAAEALFHIQDSFNISAEDVIDGKFLNYTSVIRLSAEECYDIVETANEKDDHHHTIIWGKACLDDLRAIENAAFKLRSLDGPPPILPKTDESELYEMYVEALTEQGNPYHAITALQAWAKYSPYDMMIPSMFDLALMELNDEGTDNMDDDEAYEHMQNYPFPDPMPPLDNPRYRPDPDDIEDREEEDADPDERWDWTKLIDGDELEKKEYMADDIAYDGVASTGFNNTIEEDHDRLCTRSLEPDKTVITNKHRCFFKQTHPTHAAYLRLAPFKVEVINASPKLLLFHDVVTPAEAEQLIKISSLRLSDIGPDTGYLYENTFELDFEPMSSYMYAYLDSNMNPVVRNIKKRSALITGLAPISSERLNVQNFGVGGAHPPHVDSQIRLTRNFYSDGWGSRLATLQYSLHKPNLGGAIVFPTLNISYNPKPGDALMWYNVNSKSGMVNMGSLHAECPTIIGHKWIAHQWFRENWNFARKSLRFYM